ncbi:hypothetical protein ACFW3Z_11745 [Nocardiopsis alba]|uniref:hypothetical protein n=1 Tax=Nocardiopsis alba TaxID=53437 RepID=UPI0033BED533
MLPLHREFHKTRPQRLPAGEWRSLRFDVDHEGREGAFYALVGQYEPQGALYDLSVGVVLEGVDRGAEVQIRASEYVKVEDAWVVARDRPIDSPVHVGGRAHFTYSWKDLLEPGRRVRVRVAQYGRSEAVIRGAEAVAFYLPDGHGTPAPGPWDAAGAYEGFHTQVPHGAQGYGPPVPPPMPPSPPGEYGLAPYPPPAGETTPPYPADDHRFPPAR